MTAPDNVLIVSKSRSDRIAPGAVFRKPGGELSDLIIEWIEDSEPPSGARTLGEAVNMAVAEGILAAEEKSAERYKEAKRRLLAWCDAERRLPGSPRPRRRPVQGARRPGRRPQGPGTTELPGRDVAPAATCAGIPFVSSAFLMNAAVMSDEDRLRAIDQGRA